MKNPKVGTQVSPLTCLDNSDHKQTYLGQDTGQGRIGGIMKYLILTLFTCFATTVLAEDPITTPYDGSFEDATFAVESAIVGKGLVIDFVSHTGAMLNRTAADVGSDAKIFDAADIFLFCSAVVSRQVMEADPANIQHCPYAVFVTERDGEVTIGHKQYDEGPMKMVQQLLADIVDEASAF